MKKHLLTALTVLTTLAASLHPVLTKAHTLDLQFACNSDAHTFIEGLIHDEYIEPNPTHVEANSVNAFRPKQGSDLTAFGFPVHAVFGYKRSDPLFKVGAGQSVPNPLYGAVVSGAADAVEARVHQAGSNAVVREVIPLTLSAVVCNDH